MAWQLIDSDGSSPRSREDGTWTPDPTGRTAYLFGGRDGGTVFDDLWVFDLGSDTWRQLAPDGDIPPARFGHEAVWVDGIGVVVFAGQAGPTTFFNDLWAYDASTDRWRELAAEGSRPKPRYGTCGAVGPDGRLWISHGFTEDGTRFADTQAFDFSTGRWSDATADGEAPVNRCLHGCWWTDDGRLALYGGQTTGVTALGDLWTLAGAGTPEATWTRSSGELPSDRNLYAFARHDERVVVVGGSRPPGRSGAMLIDDPVGGRVILFGGKNADGSFDDLWELLLPG
jgi:hypothetical protein